MKMMNAARARSGVGHVQVVRLHDAQLTQKGKMSAAVPQSTLYLWTEVGLSSSRREEFS